MAEKSLFEEQKTLLSRVLADRCRLEQIVEILNRDEAEARGRIVEDSLLLCDRIKQLEINALKTLDDSYQKHLRITNTALNKCQNIAHRLDKGCDLSDEVLTDVEIVINTELSDYCTISESGGRILSFQPDDQIKESIMKAQSLGQIKTFNNCVNEPAFSAFDGPASQSFSRVNDPELTSTNKASFPNEINHTKMFLSVPKTQRHPFAADDAISKPEITRNTNLPTCPPTKAVYEISFLAKSTTDVTDCYFNGACFLKDRRLVLVDQKHQKLKLFAVSLQLEAELVVGSKPFDVAVTSVDEIAVTLPDKCLVQFFDGFLKPLNVINTQQPCLGIAAENGRIYVFCETSGSKRSCINIYDMSKQLLSKIIEEGNQRGWFKGTEYIAVSPFTNDIYFTRKSFGKCKIYCFDVTGKLKWKSGFSSSMESSFALVAVAGGVVIAADDVECFSENGKQRKKLISSSKFGQTGSPYVIAVNHDMDMLMATYFDPGFLDNSNHNTVKLYRLMYS